MCVRLTPNLGETADANAPAWPPAPKCDYQNQGAPPRKAEMNITVEAAAITAVAIQPTYFKYPCISKRPMILLFAVISIMTVITGAATTPLMTALQNSALIGAIDEKLIPVPTSVATTIVA